MEEELESGSRSNDATTNCADEPEAKRLRRESQRDLKDEV